MYLLSLNPLQQSMIAPELTLLFSSPMVIVIRSFSMELMRSLSAELIRVLSTLLVILSPLGSRAGGSR